jgi:hypothetical protein
MKSTKTTIRTWLKANLGPKCLAPLTSNDSAALVAASELIRLWARGDEQNRASAAQAFGLTVRTMQPSVWHLAFHLIAQATDWDLRFELWTTAGLPDLEAIPPCKYGPTFNGVSDWENARARIEKGRRWLAAFNRVVAQKEAEAEAAGELAEPGKVYAVSIDADEIRAELREENEKDFIEELGRKERVGEP